MNIYFKHIRFKNFMSYEWADVDLNKPGYIFVNGENNNPDDSAKSNGCGKSTIFNAISWCLTGQTTSGAKNVENIYSSGDTFVELEFLCENNIYVIKRYKSPSKLKIFINGEDKSGKGIRDSEKLLSEYLPQITDSLINSVIILGQGLPQRFTSNTPSGRKEVLETLSKSDFMIEDIKTRISDRRDELNLLLREQEDKLLENSSSEKSLVSLIESNESKLNSLESKDELVDKIKKLEAEEEEIKFEKYNTQVLIDDLKSNITSVSNNLINFQNKKQQELDNLELKDISDIKDLISNTVWEINNKKTEINKLKSVVDVCPTCGQKLPGVYKPNTEFLEKEVKELDSNLFTYKQTLSSAELYNKNLIDAVNNKFNELQDEFLRENELFKNELKEKEKVVNSLNDTLTQVVGELTTYTTKLNALENYKNDLTLTIEENKIKLNDIKANNIVINNKIASIKKSIDINSKMSTIIKRDFRGYLLKNVVEFISSRCDFYSEKVFGTRKLKFELNGNNISISYDEKEYELLSGGEKQKIDIILQLSIRDMLRTYLQFSSNILVLDEITDALDVVGAQKIFNLISSTLNDVETIFIISHHSDFEIPYDGEIHIIKGSDKISRII